MKFLKRVFISILVLCVLYCGAWMFMAYKTNQSLKQFYTVDAKAAGIEFYGEQPKLSGFPLVPTIIYRDGFRYNDTDFKFNSLSLKGFPIPTRPVTLKMDGNIVITNNATKQALNFDRLHLSMITPTSTPIDTTQAEIAKWQKNVGKMTVHDFLIQSRSIHITGQGYVGLDSNLQPIALLPSKVKGYEEMVSFLIKQKTIKPLVGAIALSALNGMATTDETTNEKRVEFDVKLQNRQLSLGPLNTLRLPPVVWE